MKNKFYITFLWAVLWSLVALYYFAFTLFLQLFLSYGFSNAIAIAVGFVSSLIFIIRYSNFDENDYVEEEIPLTTSSVAVLVDNDTKEEISVLVNDLESYTDEDVEKLSRSFTVKHMYSSYVYDDNTSEQIKFMKRINKK